MSERKLERSKASSSDGRREKLSSENEDGNKQEEWERLRGGDVQAALKWLKEGGPLHPRSSHSATPDDSRNSQGQDCIQESRQMWLRIAKECIGKLVKGCETAGKPPKDRTMVCMIELLARLSHAAESPSGVNSQTLGLDSDISELTNSDSLRSVLLQRLQRSEAEERLFTLCMISTGDIAHSSALTPSTVNDALLQVSQQIGKAVEVLQQSSSSASSIDLSAANMLISAFVRNIRCRRVMEAGSEEAQDLVSSLLQAVTAFCNTIFDSTTDSASPKESHELSARNFSNAAADCMEALAQLVSSRLASPEMSMGLWHHAG
eukprot:3410562-Rhodomonas_salina.1